MAAPFFLGRTTRDSVEAPAMFFWTLILLLLGLVSAWRLSSRLSSSQLFRMLLTPGLGLALTFSLYSLADQLLSPLASLGLTSLLLVGVALVSSKLPEADTLSFEPKRAHLAGIGFLALASFVFNQGILNLNPPVELLLWELPLHQTDTRSAFRAVVSLFGTDPWLGTQVTLSLLQLSVVLGVFPLCRRLFPEGNFGWFAASVYLLGASSESWLVFQEPQDSLLHLFTFASLVFLYSPPPFAALALPSLTGLTFLQPLQSLALLLGRASTRKRSSAVLLGVGLSLQLATGLSSEGVLAALYALYLLRPQSPWRPTHLRLILTGLLAPGLAWLGLAALAADLAQGLERQWLSREPGTLTLTRQGLQIPKQGALTLAALTLFWFGIAGAESELNDRVLIASQKEKVSLLRLLPPQSLSSWLSWRGPQWGFGTAEQEALEQLQELDGEVVYLSAPLPDPRSSALLSLASGRRLTGWTPGSQPSQARLHRSFALYQATQDPDTLSGAPGRWLLRPGREPVAIPQTPQPAPHLTHTVYLSELHGAPKAQDSLLQAKLAAEQALWVDAASLCPVKLELHNPNRVALAFEEVSGLIFQPYFPGRIPSDLQSQVKTPVELPTLEPGESVVVTAYLRTENPPLDYGLALALSTSTGALRPIPFPEPVQLRSRRLTIPLDPPFGEKS